MISKKEKKSYVMYMDYALTRLDRKLLWLIWRIFTSIM